MSVQEPVATVSRPVSYLAGPDCLLTNTKRTFSGAATTVTGHEGIWFAPFHTPAASTTMQLCLCSYRSSKSNSRPDRGRSLAMGLYIR